MNTYKKILVTGGAGFIGTHLCRRLLADGHTVISLDNYVTGSKENHLNGVEYIEGHTKDIFSVVECIPDLVFHLGEYPRVEQSFGDVRKVFDLNIVGTEAVLEFCRAHGSKLVYAGSSTKFADGGMGRDQSPYAWTKATNTDLVRNYGEWFGVQYAITYFYNVYGPGERGDVQSGTVIAIFAEQVANGDVLTVSLPGSQRRNFTHVFDIVEGLVRIGESGEGDEYGLGHQDAYSILEVAEMFGGKIEMGSLRQGNRMGSNVDLKRAQLELDWRPHHSLPEYIQSL